MSVPYDETVLTSNASGLAALRHPRGPPGPDPAVRAALGAACISSSAILVTLAHVGPATAAFYRCALALPALIPLAVAEQRAAAAPGRWRYRLYAVLAGLFLAVDPGAAMEPFDRCRRRRAGVATVLGNLQVLFVAMLAWLILKERPARRFVTMLPVVFAGVVLVSGAVGGDRRSSWIRPRASDSASRHPPPTRCSCC